MTRPASKLAITGGTPVRTEPWPQWPERGEPEERALMRVLGSAQWGGFPSPGPEAAAFGQAFAAYLGDGHAVPCTNGTWSLMLALQAARVSRGAEVITTAYSFVGTAGGILAAGCTPVFADVSPDTYCIDPAAVEAAITPRTEAVMPVHLGCAMADMDRLTALCSARGLALIEDCAHAHGMQWRGRSAGTLGDAGSFSMQSSKLLTAGEGGAVTTRDAALAARLWSLVNCGRRETEAERGIEPQLGYNLRITELQAALLRAQLVRLPGQHARRERNVAKLAELIAGLPAFSMPPADARVTRRTYYQLILRYDAAALGGVPRDRVVDALEAEGIPCSGQFYVPISDDPLFAWDPCTNPLAHRGMSPPDAAAFPVAAHAAYEASLWLPHPLFLGSERDAQDIAAALAKIQAGADLLRSA
jgi:L-glutamine:scyllo-inosose aminotransferase